MGENKSLTNTVIPSLKEDSNANECIKSNLSSQESEPSRTDDELERKHFQRIVNVFRSYKAHGVRRVKGSLAHVRSLPPRQRGLLRGHVRHLVAVGAAVERNHALVEDVLKDVEHLFHNVHHHTTHTTVGECVDADDVEKVCGVFRQLFREWSVEGAGERDASFGPVLREIEARFPVDQGDRSSIRILVPGAGLGRLPFEIARRGYSCQGNEFSLFMLFTSNFVLNKCQGVDLHTVHPWLHQHYNNLRSADQLQAVSFPDVNPAELPPHIDFSMAAGSFLEIYQDTDAWHCVATCFFIDTAPNIVDYVETVWRIVRPGGWWVNLGPLLYHHAYDHRRHLSVEPSYEELRHIIEEVGFFIQKEELNLATPYAQNPRSMMCHEYRSVFFVCQKPH